MTTVETSFKGRLMHWMEHPACDDTEQIVLRLLINEGRIIRHPEVQVALGWSYNLRPDWSELFELYWQKMNEGGQELFTEAELVFLNSVLSLMDLRTVRLNEFLTGLDARDAVRVLLAVIEANGLTDSIGVATYLLMCKGGPGPADQETEPLTLPERKAI